MFRYTFKNSPYLMLGLALISIPAAQAGVVYSTGFETSDGYTTGPISGQNGWQVFNSPLAQVENTFADGGSQALWINGNSNSDQNGAYHVDAPTEPIIELSADLYIASGIENEWQFSATGPGLSGYIGGINLIPTNPVGGLTDNIQIESGSLGTVGTFNLNTWNLVDFVFDMDTQTYSFSLNGTLIASGLAFCGSNSGCTGAPVASYADSFFDVFGSTNSTDEGYMDNFSLTQSTGAAPEPGTLLLMGAGLALVAGRKFARK